MALLTPTPTTGPTGIRTALPGHSVPGAAVQAAAPGFLDAHLAKAGGRRCEPA